MNERELLARIARGDQAALVALYEAYQPRLARFLCRFTHSDATIDEVVNDVMLVVWQTSTRFRGDSSPSTWILGIAYNKMLKALSKVRPSADEEDIGASTDLDTARDLARALRKLPGPQGAVVVLAYEFGYSYKEISEILACPENTVKTRMLAARKALKSLLEA